jgi:hypothetical protein
MSATVVALAVMSVLVIEGLLRSADRREMLPLGDRGHVGHSTYPGSGAHGIHADVTLICQVASGVVNAALGCEAVASVPAGRTAMGGGANTTARYVGSAIGTSVIAVISTRPGLPPGPAGLLSGFDTASSCPPCSPCSEHSRSSPADPATPAPLKRR